MSKQRKYTDTELVEAVATSRSIRTVLEKIGLTPAGGNYETVQTYSTAELGYVSFSWAGYSSESNA